MRELQDQLEAEQYFSVSKSLSFFYISILLVQCECQSKLSAFLPSDALQNSGQRTKGGD